MPQACDKNIEKTMKTKIIPPDGGWGWMVVIAFALNNVIMVPLIQGMGLVFKDLFNDLNISVKDKSTIMGLNMSFGMTMGLIHGPLLQAFGYRKVAIAGAILFVTGLMATAFSTEFMHFIICYGLITSFGIGITMASFSLAINTYFKEKRGRAMGMAMTFTGLGPILLPLLISAFLNIYTLQGTILILGAMALHTFVAALLLQPVEWHAKRSVDEPNDKEDNDLKLDITVSNNYELKRTISISSLNDSSANKSEALNITEEIQEKIVVRHDSVASLPTKVQNASQSKSSEDNLDKDSSEIKPYQWWNSAMTLESVNLGSCLMIFDGSIQHTQPINDLISEKPEEKETKKRKGILKNSQKNYDLNDIEKQLMDEKIQAELKNERSDKKKGLLKRMLHGTVDLFDLTLLTDPIYVNMMVGMAIAMFSEINFSILLPFILDEIDFSTDQIAVVMSTIATLDLITRGLSPFVGELLHQPPRVVYLGSLAMLILSRTILVFCTGYIPVIFMALGLGISKGFRSVYATLVLPSYIPIERLANATGLQTLVNGLTLMGLGIATGIIRQMHGNYTPCIILMNGATGFTILMWVTEMYIVNRLNRRKQKYDKQQEYKAVPVND